MPHKLCPNCKKHSIIFVNHYFDSVHGEHYFDYYCRTCKRIIYYEEFCWGRWKRYVQRDSGLSLVAVSISESDVDWKSEFYGRPLKEGDYVAISHKGTRLAFQKEFFELNYSEV